MTMPAAAEFLGVSVRTLGERVRLRRCPHRRPPFGRKVLLFESELRAYLDGAELEVRELEGNGRVVRPKAAAA